MTTETIKPVSFKRFGGDFDGFSGDLGGSFARYGFAVISDHDLPQARIEAALAATKAFFALPEAVKRFCAGKIRLHGGRAQLLE